MATRSDGAGERSWPDLTHAHADIVIAMMSLWIDWLLALICVVAISIDAIAFCSFRGAAYRVARFLDDFPI